MPTRNRADFAVNGIQSILDQPRCRAKVLVSDNSTLPGEMEELKQYCHNRKDPRLLYIKTPQPLSMTKHWDWAIQQGLALFQENHFLFLTDRMVFKQNELENIEEFIIRAPDKIISYNHDRINDLKNPVVLEQNAWTGQIYELNCSRLLSLSSQMMFPPCLPRMLNSIASRAVLEKLKSHFGNIFSSIAPDFCFAYRCLELEDSILYYDKAIILHYGVYRSNGASVERGVVSKDNFDFQSNMDCQEMNAMTPIPECITITNAVINEYCFVKQETKSAKFPDVDNKKYIEQNAWDVGRFENIEFKEKMEALLLSYGWIKPIGNKTDKTTSHLEWLSKLKKIRFLNQINSAIWNIVKSVMKPFLIPFLIYLRKDFGLFFGLDLAYEFNSVDEAIDHFQKYSRRRSKRTDHLKALLETPLDNCDY